MAAETSLEARIQALTGIPRTVYVELQSRAAERAIQIQTDFSHCCLVYGEGEIIAWNSGYSDPLGQLILGWLDSVSHKAMMYNQVYDQIGCATSYLAPRTYGVCLFVDSETRNGSESAPAPAKPGSTPVLVPTGTISDTAMAH